MSEFKFSCPHCGQNIQCDEQWGGRQIGCPACSGNLIVPQLRPVASAARPQQPQPQAAGRPAKPAASSGKIIAWCVGGVVFLGALCFALARMDAWQSAFNKKTDQAAARASGGEMVHIAKLYQVLDATDPDKLAAGRARANRGMEQAAAAMLDAMKPQPDPTLAMPPAAPNWTLNAPEAALPKGRVNGSSGGKEFHVETVRLDRNAASAMLAFQEGAGTGADHELFVYLPVGASESLAGRSWTVTRETKSTEALQVVKRWTVNPKYAPSDKSFAKGYVLELELGEPGRDWQPGRIYLALPDTNQTVLAGEFSIAVPRKETPEYPRH